MTEPMRHPMVGDFCLLCGRTGDELPENDRVKLASTPDLRWGLSMLESPRFIRDTERRAAVREAVRAELRSRSKKMLA